MSNESVKIKPLVAGNWKMNGLAASLEEAAQLSRGVTEGGFASLVDVMLCPPATLLAAMVAGARDSSLLLGGQDCHSAACGAHTGDISAEMLKDAGATAVIVGHSERRANHFETDKIVRAKAEAAYRAGLIAIICIGETAGERQYGLAQQVAERQLLGSLPASASAANTIIAYEPVWAIGTGLTPTVADVAQMHDFLREVIVTALAGDGDRVRLLYGGSVKPGNAVELMGVNNVDGALVGGASLKAQDLLGIISSYKEI